MVAAKYKIGLLVDDPKVSKWVRDLADWANGHSAIELAALIIDRSKARRPLLKWLLGLERKLAFHGVYRPFRARSPIAGIASDKIIAGDFSSPPAKELSKIEELELDAIVSFGDGASRAALCRSAKDGLISIVHGAKNRSGDGFREVLEGRPATSFTIARFDNDGPAFEALFEGSIATDLLYGWNVASLNARARPYLQRTLEQLASGRIGKGRIEVGDGREPPHLPDIFAYAAKSVARIVRKAVRRYSGAEFNWGVAFTHKDWSEADFASGTIVPNPPGTFLADPFTLVVKGERFLFVEEFPFVSRKGVISAYRIEKDHAERIGIVLEEPYHLSFPYVFGYENEIYMVPESGADRSIKLYRSEDFPTRWSLAKVLMSNVPAVDTCLFEHDQRWWMLTTINGDGPALNNAELHAFHSDHPLGEWIPHKLNPIVMDASKGRNGGFLRDSEGTPCRVSQSPGFTFYGEASAIYRIERLTPEEYREILVKEVRPSFFEKLDGTHHIHCMDGATVYDFMRVEHPPKG